MIFSNADIGATALVSSTSSKVKTQNENGDKN
jgi:hypothetical protein